MNINIVKAELLWTKKCPFHCSYCGMVQNNRPQDIFDYSRFYKAMQNLKNIGCEFVAIYGAEPLSRMQNLDDVIKIQKELGLEQTIITALYQPHKIETLISAGLNSISVSYDMQVQDKDRNEKSSNGIRLLNQFNNVNDRACITTLAPDNIDIFLESAKDVLNNGYWLLFDLVHPGYPGISDGYSISKCIGDDVHYDKDKINNIFNTLIEWKKDGKKVHASIKLLEFMRDNLNTSQIRKSWHCGNHNTLGWVTIGPNLELYYCDDCQVKYSKSLDEMGSKEDWEEFLIFRNNDSKERCPGCFWNTHIQAIQVIESGDIDTYVHNRLNVDSK
jgi:MoaA/NifB/PqqE/SkfB family radical SAM enzyme